MGHRQGRQDGRATLGQGRQAENPGHRPADQEAHGNLRRRIRRRRKGFHQAPERRRQAILRMAEYHAHARVHAYQEEKPWTGRALAVALSRHHDRSRQERRPDARLSRRTWHRRQHLRHVLDRQRSAPEHLAGRRHDAVPLGKEHQLGRRVPHSAAGPLARPYQGRDRLRTASCSITTGSRPSLPWPAIRMCPRS